MPVSKRPAVRRVFASPTICDNEIVRVLNGSAEVYCTTDSRCNDFNRAQSLRGIAHSRGATNVRGILTERKTGAGETERCHSDQRPRGVPVRTDDLHQTSG